ncbi:copper amine oxidase N-terminal domain-containing protein [Cohnella sp. AR92]|uniref:copper amine oxidase N-terminal domain-containing protein n=1 Tax=Cohnella sp. AR92 TaxID=648716 RepID=UPI000F8ECFC9|nr:copper amine oxidase N-terminal domain-containing protein [Cohnella sp. AR92]RUS48661.1 copper amine oxidase N-terminal domain-containing protein [Cohnella sp. AR92]
MRKFWLLVVSAALFFAYSGMAGAATQQKPIQVLLNGAPVTFAVEPTAIEGKTFVEFRSLFAALGYNVDYDAATKKIKAVSGDRTIEMRVGATQALLNGSAVQVDDQLKVLNSRTLVGVRFIATLSGKDVTWDPATRTVVIVDKGPTPEQEAAVYRLLDKMQLVEAAHDAKGMIALFSEDSPIKEAYGEQLAATWERVQTKTTFLQKAIVSYSNEQVILETTEENVKTGGNGFSPNYQGKFTYTLQPDMNGEWKIYMLEMTEYKILNVADLFEPVADVPAADAQALRAVLDEQVKAASEENLDAYLATMYFDNENSKKASGEQIQQIFDATDSQMTIEKFAVVDYYDSDKATILFEVTTEVKAQGHTIKVRATISNDAEKREGKWLLNPLAVQLANEQL